MFVMDNVNFKSRNRSFAERRKLSLLAKKSKKARKRGINKTQPLAQDLNTLFRYYQHNNLDLAISLALSITENFPEHPFSWNILGAALLQVGRVEEALLVNQRFVDLCPKDANAHNNLASTLLEMDRVQEAESSFRKAISLDVNNAVFYNNLGNALVKILRYSDAEINYKKAITLKYDYPEAHNNLANIYANLGRLSEAVACYEKAITLNPKYAEAFRMYSLVKTFQSKNDQYLKMQELYRDQNLSEEQRCDICFALGKVYEDLQDYKKASEFLSEGNALRKKLLNYDIDEDVKLFNEIQSTYPKISSKAFQFVNSAHSVEPIFIVGMPRSGTTLVEQIISAHSKVTGAGELPFVSQFGELISRGLNSCNEDSLADFRLKYLNNLEKISGNNIIVTDKMPHNFLYLGLIRAVFPQSKIVHVQRNPAATCWSNYQHFFTSQKLRYCYSLNDIVNYYALYQDLMNFWEKSFGDMIYNLDYEFLTVNQEKETKNLINFLDLEWERACLNPHNNKRIVQTTSNFQVRKKIYQGSSNKWKDFKPFLDNALDGIQDK
jgi:tetratricopeptide (TPR) repeat protein